MISEPQLESLQELGLKPRILAALANTSVTKLQCGDMDEEQFSLIYERIELIEDHTDQDLAYFINRHIYVDDTETSLSLLKLLQNGVDLDAYFKAPVHEVERVFPQWRLTHSSDHLIRAINNGGTNQ